MAEQDNAFFLLTWEKYSAYSSFNAQHMKQTRRDAESKDIANGAVRRNGKTPRQKFPDTAKRSGSLQFLERKIAAGLLNLDEFARPLIRERTQQQAVYY